ncbi:MAG TPA: Crp/Fnr family transcriptional regulator [Xenococcaceae cyanobacterium]|jgi:CRP-like cAMP-binding protein
MQNNFYYDLDLTKKISFGFNSKYRSQLQHFSKDNLLPALEAYFWLIEEGAVKTYTWNKEGIITTMGYWGATDVVGQPLSCISPYEIKCLTEVSAVSIKLQDSESLSAAIYRHIQQTEELLHIIRSDRAYDKLKRFFIWLSDKFGQPVPQGKLIDLPLTHQELAEAISTTRVSITKLINQLETEKFIVRQRRSYIVVPN